MHQLSAAMATLNLIKRYDSFNYHPQFVAIVVAEGLLGTSVDFRPIFVNFGSSLRIFSTCKSPYILNLVKVILPYQFQLFSAIYSI